MIELKDRIYTLCDTVGIGNIVVGTPREGYQGWDVISNGNTVYYCIVNDTQWEVGHGVKTDAEITRNLLASSNGELISLDGNSSVFCTYPAEKSVVLDADGNLPVSKDIIAGGIIESSSLVKAPTIVTDAVLVGGNSEEDGSEIAELLDVYTKGEVDKLQEEQDEKWAESQSDQDKSWGESQKTQDTKITENKSSIQGLASDLESTQRDVVELEEEIEALAPSFDRGRWKHDETQTIKGSPDTGSYYLTTDTEVTNQFNDVAKIYFNNTDAQDPPKTHTFEDVTEGMYIEVFEALDSSYLLATVDTITKESGYTVMDLTVVKAEGEAGLSEEETPDVSTASSQEGIRVKFFTLADTEVDLDSLMPKAGGTFTGNVTTDKGGIYINTSNKSTGNNFSVTNGNSVKQLNINGYGNFEYDKSNCPPDRMSDKTVATMGDLLNLYTLGSSDNMTYRPPKSLSNYEFATDRNSVNGISNVYLYRLKNNENNMVDMADYEPTPSTEFKIYYPSTGEIIFTTLVRNWRQSSYSSGDRMFDVPGYGHFYKLGYSMSSSSAYRVMLTNMIKIK